jgi:hypothetical protein
MGYMMAYSACIGCGKLFGYNPHSVPSSSAVTGEREPICRTCVERINPLRIARHLPPIVPAPDAYEPAEE